MNINEMKKKHIFYVTAAVVTLSLGFSILWQIISVSGPKQITANVCSGPYILWLHDSKNQSSTFPELIPVLLRASNKLSDGTFGAQVQFFSDASCLNQLTAGIDVPIDASQVQFYIKFVPSVGTTLPQTFRIGAESARFWSGAMEMTVSGGSTGGGPGDPASFDVTRLGAWGIGEAKDSSVNPLLQNNTIDGFNLAFEWSDIDNTQTHAAYQQNGNAPIFNWDEFDRQFEYLINKNLNVGFTITAGPAAPDWIYCSDYDSAYTEPSTGKKGKSTDRAGFDSNNPTNCVPRVLVDGQTSQQSPFFPHYKNAFYTAVWYQMLDGVAAHVAAYAQTHPSWPNHILYWQSAEGSTGDEGPYKGTLRNSQYAISDLDWDAYKKLAWGRIYENLKNNTSVQLLINSGNDGGNFDWAIGTPGQEKCIWNKAGNLSHAYSFIGEIHTYERGQAVKDRLSGCNRVRGEFQNAYDFSTWKDAPKANTYMLTLSAVTMGLDILNLTGASTKEVTNTSDLTLYDTFTRYAGYRKASDANKAFVYLRDVPDLADTTRFPVIPYGAVIPSVDAIKYTNAVKSIQNSDRGLSQQAEIITERTQQYFNAARRIAIVSSDQFQKNSAIINKPQFVCVNGNATSTALNCTTSGEMFEASNPYPNDDDTYSIYDHDFGIDMLPDNYGKFMTQQKPNDTSIGQWRIGSDKAANSRYGRYARSFDIANGKKEMVFDIDNSLDGSVGVKNLKVSVTYYNSGTNEWALGYTTTSAGTPANVLVSNSLPAGSARWETKTWILPSVNLLNKYQKNGLSGDLALTYVGNGTTPFNGGNTVFAMIEVETTSQSAQTASYTAINSGSQSAPAGTLAQETQTPGQQTEVPPTQTTPPTTPTVQAPVITSKLTDTAVAGAYNNYLITATNSPTSFDATGLPVGFVIEKDTGHIKGTVTTPGTYVVSISAINSGGVGTATLTFKIK